jgi:hypothetical protein
MIINEGRALDARATEEELKKARELRFSLSRGRKEVSVLAGVCLKMRQP